MFFSAPTLELRTDQPEQFGAPFNGKAYYDLRPALLSTTTVTVQVEVYDDDLRERAMLLPFEVYAPTLEEDSRIKLTGTTRGEFLVIDNDLARATTLSVDRVRLTEGETTTIQFEILGNVESSTIQFNNVGVAEITQFTPTAVTADDVTEHGQADYSDYRVSFIPASGEAGREVTRVTDEGIVEVLVEALNDDYYELREDVEVVFELHLSDNADGSVSFIDTYSFTLRIDDTDEPQIELVSDDPTRQDEDGARLELRAQLNNHPPLGNPGVISGTIRFNSVAERGADFSVSGIGAPDDSADTIYSKEFGTFTIPRSADSVARVRPVIATIEAIADNDPEPTERIDLAVTELEYQEYDTEQGIYYIEREIKAFDLSTSALIRFDLEFANDDFVTARFEPQDVPVDSEGESLPLLVSLDRPLPRLYAYTADLLDVSNALGLATGVTTVISLENQGTPPVEVMFEDDFNFNFFGNSYDSVYIHRNGFVTFGAAIDASYVNASNANNEFLGQLPFIAPLWDELSVGLGKVAVDTVGTAPNRRFVIEWSGIQFDRGGSSTTESLRFQVILHEGSDQVQFNYIKVDVTGNSNSFGNSAWIGIGAGDGRTNVEIGHNQPVIENGTKITFTPPLKGLLLVTDSGAEFDEEFPLDVTNEFTLDEEPTLYVVAAEDNEAEDDRETHELGLQVASEEEIIQVATQASAALVTILDLDKPRVRFGEREYTVTEGQALTITLDLGGRLPLDTPVTVALEFALDSTAGSSDFSITPEEVSISSAMPNSEFVFNATSDILPDDGEFVTLNLISDNIDLLTVGLPTTVQIISRAPTVAISITEETVTEGEQVEIVLTLSEPIAPTRFNGSYSRENASGETFNSIISGSTRLPNESAVTRTLPFGFELYGNTYTKIQISRKGFVYFVGPNAPTLDLVGIEDNPDFRDGLPGYPVIAPLWDEYTTTDGDVYVEVSGTAPNRRYAIEWSNFRSSDEPGVRRDFQLFLHEGSNKIDLIYESANSNYATVAISGQPGAGLFEQPYFNEPGVVDNTRVTFTPQSVSDIVTVSAPIQYGPLVPRYIRVGDDLPFEPATNLGVDDLTIESDEGAAGVLQDLPFEFEFYNNTYQQIYISNAGLIHFVGADDPAPEFTFDNPDFQVNPPGYPTIAPLWDGYSFSASGGISVQEVGEVGERTYRIDWKGLLVTDQPGAAAFNFALVLHERSNYIDLLYRDANGNSATIAISGPPNSNGVASFQQFYFNEQIELSESAEVSQIRLRPQIFSDFESSGDNRLPRKVALADFKDNDRTRFSFNAKAAIDNLYERDGETEDIVTVVLELAEGAELELAEGADRDLITINEYSALARFSQTGTGEQFDLDEGGDTQLEIVLIGDFPDGAAPTTLNVRARPESEARNTDDPATDDYNIVSGGIQTFPNNNPDPLVIAGVTHPDRDQRVVEPLEDIQLFLEPEADKNSPVVTRRQPYNPDPDRGRDPEDAFIVIRDTDPIELSLTVADGISRTPEASRGGGIEVELFGSNLIGTGIRQDLLVTLAIGGNATNGEDYTLRGVLNSRVGIPAGARSTAFTIFVEDDDLYEEDEDIRLSIIRVVDSDEQLLEFLSGDDIKIVIEDNDRIGVSLDRVEPATLPEGGTSTRLTISLEEPVNFLELGIDDNYSIGHIVQTEEEFSSTVAIAPGAIKTVTQLTTSIWLADNSAQEAFVEFELYGQLNRIGSNNHLFYRTDGLVGFFQERDSTDALGTAFASSLAELNELVDQPDQPAPSASDFFFAPLWNVFDSNTGIVTVAYEPQYNAVGDTIGYLPHIRWENLRYFRDDQSDITFGMRLLPDGEIQFYYETLELPMIGLDGFLEDTTIGIANGLARPGNEFYRKGLGDIQIREGSVITFTPPDNVLRLTRSGGSPSPEDFQVNFPRNLLQELGEGVTEDVITLTTLRDNEDEDLEVIDLHLEIGGANPIFEIGDTGSRRLSIFDSDATLVTATLALADATQTRVDEGDRLTVRVRLTTDVNVTSGFNLDTPHREDFNNQFPIDLLPLFPEEGEQVIDVPLIISRDLLSEGTETLRLFLTADNGTNISLEQANSELEITVTDEIFVVSLEVLDPLPDTNGQSVLDEGDPISVRVTLDHPLPLGLNLGGGYILNDGRVIDDNPVQYLEGANFDNLEYIAHSLKEQGYKDPLPIGFDFEFYGQHYDEIYVNPSGFLSFGDIGDLISVPYNASTDLSVGASALPAGYAFPSIIPFWAGADASDVNYVTLGDFGDLRFVVEWTSEVEGLIGDDAGKYANYQVVLYERSGNVEFRYNRLPDATGNDDVAGRVIVGISDGIGRAVQPFPTGDGNILEQLPPLRPDARLVFSPRYQYLQFDSDNPEQFNLNFPLSIIGDFSAGQTEKLINIDLENDNLLNGERLLGLELTTNNDSFKVDAEHQFLVRDDDVVSVAFEAIVEEGARYVEINEGEDVDIKLTVSTEQPPTSDVELIYRVRGTDAFGRAAADDPIFAGEGTLRVITVPVAQFGSPIIGKLVTIEDDNEPEPYEQFEIVLEGVNVISADGIRSAGTYEVTTGLDQRILVLITDNEPTDYLLSDSAGGQPAQAVETDGFYTAHVTRVGIPTDDIVEYTVNGAGDNPVKFGDLVGAFPNQPNLLTGRVDPFSEAPTVDLKVELADDIETEPVEQFEIALTDRFAASRLLVDLLDATTPEAQFDSPDIELNEGDGTHNLTVNFSNMDTFAHRNRELFLDVEIVINDGFNLNSEVGDVTIITSALERIKYGIDKTEIPLTIIDDSFYEGTERFEVHLNALGFVDDPGTRRVYPPNSQVIEVTVKDNDEPALSLSTPTPGNIGEADGPVELNINWNNPPTDEPNTELALNLELIPDGILLPRHYNFDDATLIGIDGTTTVEVEINDNPYYELDRQLAIQLAEYRLVDSRNELTAPTDDLVVTWTIIDDEELEFNLRPLDRDDASASVEGGQLRLMVLLPNLPPEGTGRDVTVDTTIYDAVPTLAGSAADRSDFIAPASRLTIPAGANSAELVIQIIDDTQAELTETVNIRVTDINLGHEETGRYGVKSFAGSAVPITTLFIHDNDRVNFNFPEELPSGSEGDPIAVPIDFNRDLPSQYQSAYTFYRDYYESNFEDISGELMAELLTPGAAQLTQTVDLGEVQL